MFTMFLKSLLIKLKYNILFFRREYLFHPQKLTDDIFEANNSSLIICGNGPSYTKFENEYLANPEKYKNVDILMLNWGAFYSKLKVRYHIFEIPHDSVEINKMVELLEKKNNNSLYKIYRPNYRSSAYKTYKKIKKVKIDNLYILSEMRIRTLNKKIIFSDLKKIKNNSVLFCRGSIIYATLFAIKLGYKEIKYVGIDPHTTASFYASEAGKGKHLTAQRFNNYSTYDIINIIANATQFSDINFSVYKESSLQFLDQSI